MLDKIKSHHEGKYGSGYVRGVWRPSFIINHPDNGPRDLEYNTIQYFHCKACKERFGVSITVKGLSKERYERYVKKETQNLAQTGGIGYNSVFDISKEFEETMRGLCPNCIASATSKFLKENK